MKTRRRLLILLVVLAVLAVGCFGEKQGPAIAVETTSATPGGTVTQKGTVRKLLGTPIEVGKPLPPTRLVDATTMKEVDLTEMKGSVLIVSIVPSIDTKVCEAQTHYLGEEGDRLPPGVKRITVSRDTPFAQNRFAEEAKLTDIQYLSDYKEGQFGSSTGLLVEGVMLLARTVVVVDGEGIVQYIQVVPELTHLPDMETAFDRAVALIGG